MNFVLDASVTMSWLFSDARPADRAIATAVLEALKLPNARASVPVTWALEVANVLARGEARHVITEAQSEAFLHMLSRAPVHADQATFRTAQGDTLQLARCSRLSVHDASYLELALRTAQPLASLDADLNKAARKAGVMRFTG